MFMTWCTPTQPLTRLSLCCYEIMEHLTITNLYTKEEIRYIVTSAVSGLFRHSVENDVRFAFSKQTPLHVYLKPCCSPYIHDEKLFNVTLAFMLFVCTSLEHRLLAVTEVLTPGTSIDIHIKQSDLVITYG